MEEWKDIQGYEGIYQVSNYGRVRSLERDVIKSFSGREYIAHLKEAIKTPHILMINGNKRLMCGLWKENKGAELQVSHLVAEAFVPNPNGYTVVHHIDHDSTNNRAENLIWISDEEHRALHGNERKKQVYQYTLDDKLVKIWSSIIDASKELGFDGANISKCCSPKYKSYKTYKGYKWRLEKI